MSSQGDPFLDPVYVDHGILGRDEVHVGLESGSLCPSEDIDFGRMGKHRFKRKTDPVFQVLLFEEVGNDRHGIGVDAVRRKVQVIFFVNVNLPRFKGSFIFSGIG